MAEVVTPWPKNRLKRVYVFTQQKNPVGTTALAM